MARCKPQFPPGSSGPEAFPGRLYTDLAPWWHLLSAPGDYAEAAAFYWKAIQSACSSPPHTILELGSGGGNNASFLKRHCRLTLVDLSPQMLCQSQTINPECEHLVGDMRSIRLERLFDAIFVQDAISYMLTEADLEQAIQSAFLHCRPGGAPAGPCPGQCGQPRRASDDASIGPARALSWIALAPDTRHRVPQPQGIRHDHLVRCRWWRGGGRRRVPIRPPHPPRHQPWGGRVHD